MSTCSKPVELIKARSSGAETKWGSSQSSVTERIPPGLSTRWASPMHAPGSAVSPSTVTNIAASKESSRNGRLQASPTVHVKLQSPSFESLLLTRPTNSARRSNRTSVPAGIRLASVALKKPDPGPISRTQEVTDRSSSSTSRSGGWTNRRPGISSRNQSSCGNAPLSNDRRTTSSHRVKDRPELRPSTVLDYVLCRQ